MNGRVITYILLSSLIMLGAIVLQNTFIPPPPAPTAVDVASQTTVGQADRSGSAGTPDPTDQDTDAPPAESDVETEDAQSKVVDTEASPATPLANEAVPDAADLETENEITSDPNAPLGVPHFAAADNPKDKFLTLGSLAADSPYRYLITVNQRGGTIHRVELNYRKHHDKPLKYRDLEYTGGYLGCLDCLDTASGCLIRTVGEGTPAATATASGTEGGIQVGDILLAVDGEPVISNAEFESLLNKKTKPKQTVPVTIERDEKKITFDVTLTHKPIELLRPEHSRLDPEFEYPESFVFSLLKPAFVNQVWPDLDSGMRSESWEVVSDATRPNEISLKFDIAAEKIADLGFTGPLSITKHYRIPELSTENISDLDSRSFHFDLEVEITNQGNEPQKVAYELDGPSGSPTETWWYANKIHGRSTAIGYVAGARDVIGSTERQPYVFLGCPEICKGANKPTPDVYYIASPLIDDPANRNLNYVGVDTIYFTNALFPKRPDGTAFKVDSVSAFPNGGEIPEKDIKLQKLVNATFQLTKTIEIAPGESYRQSFEIFSGPKEGDLLEQYGLDDARSFGWFAWCSKPLMWLLHFFYWITGSFSYGLAIVMLTVLVRCFMIPISRKAALNAQMMQHLQPQIKEIADKYKDDMEKRGVAQRELFKRHKYNPLNGCFMMFFQLPIFIGLYRGLSVDIALRDQPLIPGMSWCSNLSGPDQLMNWQSWMPSSLADETGWLGPFLNILPLVTMVLFIVQQKLFMPPATDDQQKMMQKMMSFMMIFMGIMFFKVAAGLCLYFITSSLWGIIERKMLPKPVLDTEKLGLAGSGRTVEGTVVPAPSKTQQKAELKRVSDLEDRKLRNIDRKKRLKKRGN